MKYFILILVPIIATIVFPYFYNLILIPFNIYSNIRKHKRDFIRAGLPDLVFYFISIIFIITFLYLYLGLSSIYFNYLLNNFESKIIFYIALILFFTLIPRTIWSKIVKYQDINKKLNIDEPNLTEEDRNAIIHSKWLIKLEKNRYIDLFSLNYLAILLFISLVLIGIYPELIYKVWKYFPFI